MTGQQELEALTRGVSVILGGARSGKSRLAEQVAMASGLRRVYVATAVVAEGDDDMRARIARHQADRGAGWTTVEEALDVARVVDDEAGPDTIVVVDCLTLWLTNVLYGERPVDPETATAELCDALRRAQGPVVVVSNEVGFGVHPPTEAGRRFRDEQGRLNQRVAAIADHVRLVVAGIPVVVR